MILLLLLLTSLLSTESWVRFHYNRGMIRYLLLIITLCVPFAAQPVEIDVGVADQHGAAIGVENSRLTGKLANIFQCPLDKSGLSFNFRLLPLARLLQELERGEVSLGIPMVKLDNRDRFAVFAKPLVQIRFILYTNRDIKLADDLSTYNFTVLRSSASVDLLKQHNAQIIEVNDWAQALALTRLGRSDGALVPLLVVKTLTADNIIGLRRQEFGSLPLSIYVSGALDNTEELVYQLNAAIEACSEQGL